jgi:hypothetical protein
MSSGQTALLPTFLVIGAMKAGTTSLAAYLQSHPDVFITNPKEPNFFGANWNRGLRWYQNLFGPAASSEALGEASTDYTKAPQVSGVPGRIASVVPQARLIYLVRDPIERIQSMYTELTSRGLEQRPLNEAVVEDTRYLDWSRYGYQLDQFLAHFERGQILVVCAEELRENRNHVIRTILGFIGVSSDPQLVEVGSELNPSAGKRQLGPIARRSRALLDRTGLLVRLPTGPKQRFRRKFGRSITAAIPSELAAQIRDQLAEDRARLRAIVGPEADRWGWI